MWKILFALWTLTLSADGLGNGQRSYSSTFWTLPFSTALSFLALVVQNYHTTWTDNGEGPNTRGRKGATTSGRKPEKTSPIHNSTKKTRLKTWHWLRQCKRIWCRVYSAKKQRHKNKIQVSRMQHRVVCYPMFQSTSYQTAFLRTNWH